MQGCWVELQCTGKKPPPMGDFTFTKIDISRALVYGGRLQRDTFASFFIVDLDKLVHVGLHFMSQELTQSFACTFRLFCSTGVGHLNRNPLTSTGLQPGAYIQVLYWWTQTIL